MDNLNLYITRTRFCYPLEFKNSINNQRQAAEKKTLSSSAFLKPSAVMPPPNSNSLYRHPPSPSLPPSSAPSSRPSRRSRLPAPSDPLTVATSPRLPPPTFDHHFFNSLPPGYRFNPTDEELVIHYLIPYLASRPLPPNRILLVDIYSYHPARLAEEYKNCGENAFYFFTPRAKKYPNGFRPKRSTDTGYWKATGADLKVISSGRGSVIGSKTSLGFYQGKALKGRKTDWLMHEFTLKTSSTNSKFDKYALCKIYRKANRSKSKIGRDGGGSTTLIDQNNDEATHHHLVSGIEGMETEQSGTVAKTWCGSADVEQHRQYQQTSSDHPSSGGQLMGDCSPPQNDQLMSAYPTPHLVSGIRTLNTEQTGTVANTGNGSADVEQHRQYQQTSSDQPSPGDQLMGDCSPPQNDQLMSAYPTPHLMSGIRTLNTEQTGTVANTGNGSADVEQHRQCQQTCSDQPSPGNQLTGDCSPPQNDQLMSAYPTPHLMSGIRTLNTEQNGMITNIRYGSAHIEELGQYLQPNSDHSSPNDHQPVSVDSTHQLTCGIRSMKMEENGQSQQAGFDPSSWNDQVMSAYPALPDFDFDPSQLFDFNGFYGNLLVDHDQYNNQCNYENLPINPSINNQP